LLQSPLAFSHALLKQTVHAGDSVIDATAGNGNDTLLLANLVGKDGRVIAFDIQEEAIAITREKLLAAGLNDRVDLQHNGHEHILEICPDSESISAIVFNLGYLPKGDKSIVTIPETTLKALDASLNVLKKKGMLLVMVYHGHPGGKKEKSAVLDFASALPQEYFNVLNYGFINQKNDPPFLLAIEKR